MCAELWELCRGAGLATKELRERTQNSGGTSGVNGEMQKNARTISEGQRDAILRFSKRREPRVALARRLFACRSLTFAKSWCEMVSP